MATEKKATTTEAKGKGTRRTLTSDQLKAKAAKAEQAAKEMLRRAYATEIDEHIKIYEGTLSTMFKQAHAKFGKRVDDIGLLLGIGKLMGIPRLVITQKEVVKRKQKDSTNTAD